MDQYRVTKEAPKLEGNTVRGRAVVYYDGTPGTETQLGKNLVERIRPGAAKPLPDVIATYNHNKDFTLARLKNKTLKLSLEKDGVHYEYELNDDDPDAVRLRSKINHQNVDGSSFGMKNQEYHYSREGDKTIKWVDKFELFEVSSVVLPSYPAAGVSLRSEQDKQAEQLTEETNKRLAQLKKLQHDRYIKKL